ncbi:MAG: hypothetical protein J7604_06630 [Sporocytophaga sp.]|uniref:hypothetical protein n=1 Tax=Sporocytophaga sp. TaxID=2231183 RepID=UPI001B0A2E74|nr:hypothetical protein [Sporocytophaga sp.]MBO9699869.1 hypothetical protein [Sporocytophaga sp.]
MKRELKYSSVTKVTQTRKINKRLQPNVGERFGMANVNCLRIKKELLLVVQWKIYTNKNKKTNLLGWSSPTITKALKNIFL